MIMQRCDFLADLLHHFSDFSIYGHAQYSFGTTISFSLDPWGALVLVPSRPGFLDARKVSDMGTNTSQAIIEGRTAMGIELGSTRIKAVLIGPDHAPIAVGSHDWENQFIERTWTYSLDAVWGGLQACYATLVADVRRRYDVELISVGALGVSAMMHGYLAFAPTANC